LTRKRKTRVFGLLFFIIITICDASANDEINDLKIEVQKLKERVTELNNIQPFREARTWGNSSAVGITAGLYNEDLIFGLDISYPVLQYLSLRLDAHFLNDLSRKHGLDYPYTDRLMHVRRNRIFAFPSVGVSGHSSMVYNTRVYGCVFFGLSKDLLKKSDYLYQFRCFGGLEVFTNRVQAFFVEFGGGGLVSMDKFLDYGWGAVVTGGSRFYL
jgi:hypothetical protein